MILSRSDPLTNKKVTSIIRDGGLVIYPCDTIYGFIGNGADPEKRTCSVKGRGADKHFLYLVDLHVLSVLNIDNIPKEILNLWPGPLSLIVNSESGGSLGIRYPDDPSLLELIGMLECPLFSSSVNRSGQAPLNDIDAICREFESEVDCIVHAGNIQNSLSSTILDLRGRPFRIIRKGAMEIPDSIYKF